MMSANKDTLGTDEIVNIMKGIIEAGGECKLTVTGNSMFPTLKHKSDSVILMSPSKRKVKKGEIVFIQRDSKEYILHRVYKTYDDYFIMNGDNQEWCEKVRFDQVIAVVKKIVRKDKEISCDNTIYKSYVFVWRSLRAYRKKIYKTYSFFRGR